MIVPDKIPAGWEICTFSEVISHHSGNSNLIKGKQFSDPSPNLFPGFSASGQDVWLDHFEHEGNAIIISAVGARCGKCFFAKGKWSAIANTHVVWPETQVLDTKYLWWMINDEGFWIRGGSGQPFVKTKASFRREFCLPPLNEQLRIVEKIEALFDEIDKGIESLRAAKSTLDLYRKSLLKSAFEGHLTAGWRARNPDSLESLDTLLARIRNERNSVYQAAIDEWEKAISQYRTDGERGNRPAKPKKLRPLSELVRSSQSRTLWPSVELGDIVSVGSGLGLTSAEMRGGPYPVYGGNGISGYHDRFFLQDSKLILGRVGAKCGVTHITDPKSWVTDNALIVTPLIDSFDSKFFRRLLEAKDLNSLGSSTGQPVISGSKIYPVVLSVPSLSEQAEISRILEARLGTAEALHTEVDACISRIEALRQSILKQAFSGKLVPQDPNDEPAATLLQRILAKKASHYPDRAKRRVSTA